MFCFRTVSPRNVVSALVSKIKNKIKMTKVVSCFLVIQNQSILGKNIVFSEIDVLELFFFAYLWNPDSYSKIAIVRVNVETIV